MSVGLSLALAFRIGVACRKPAESGGEVTRVCKDIGDFLAYASVVGVVIGLLSLLFEPQSDLCHLPAIRFRVCAEDPP